MPCQSDYMAPNATETYSHETAKLVWILSNKLNRETDTWVRDAANNSYGNSSRHNQLTAILCKLFSSMTEAQFNTFVYNGHDPDARRLADWWDRHQEVDARRRANEAAQAEHERKVRWGLTLLEKMDREEREAVVLAVKTVKV